MTALLSVRGLVKCFPGVTALQGVDFAVRAGEVHCLLGQNGAGKSTLIKVLSGAHRPDEGEIRWRGEVVSFGNPTAAMRSGVAAGPWNRKPRPKSFLRLSKSRSPRRETTLPAS